jgi:hypothetical protein
MSTSGTPSLPSTTARLAVAALALLALGACGNDSSDSADQPSGGTRPGYASSSTPPVAPPVDTPSEAPSSSAPAPASTPAGPASPAPSADPEPDPEPEPDSDPKPEVVVYAGGEAVPPLIKTHRDVGQLKGAPQDFREFVGRAADEVSEQSSCTGGAVGITVDALRTDGYAVGEVNDCGGYAAMWAKDDDGAWLEIQATQDTWDCAVLKQYRVPSEILLDSQTCFAYDGDQKVHDYRQA